MEQVVLDLIVGVVGLNFLGRVVSDIQVNMGPFRIFKMSLCFLGSIISLLNLPSHFLHQWLLSGLAPAPATSLLMSNPDPNFYFSFNQTFLMRQSGV